MRILRAFKIRLYPAQKQEMLLGKTFGCKRFIYNHMLAERIAIYRENGKSIGKLCKTEKEWKTIHPFLKKVDAIALQQARIDLDAAYDRFFRKLAGFPQFKALKARQSYRTINVNGNVAIDFEHQRLKLPKIGWVAFRDTRVITERVRSVTVSRTKSGRYFASILVKQKREIEQKRTINEAYIAGFDMSAKEFIVGDIIRYENPRFYHNSETMLKRLHRSVSRKVIGSANFDKARFRLARLYDRIGNRRTDWLQKLSTALANIYDVVVLEDLNIEGMKKWSGGLAKSVTLDFSWGAFVTMIGYKLAWRGKRLVKVDKFFPSTKMCSACGFKNDSLTLKDRVWTCPLCGMRHDRDTNAAINIKCEGIRLLREHGITVITTDTTAGTAGNHARGDSIRPATMAAGSTNREFTPSRE